jgi:lysozyme
MKNRISSRIVFFTTITITIIIAIVGIYTYWHPITSDGPFGIEVDKLRYPITGIDVSRHTGEIDFKIMKEQFHDTIDFVYIKASEGIDLIDAKLELNYVNARQNEIPVGFYHFFKFNVSGKRQANNFLKTLKDKTYDLPLVLDVEEWSNYARIPKAKILKEIRFFIDEIETQTKDKIVIYTNESGYQKYILGNFVTNKIWICSFNPQPKILSYWTFWQHSHRGKFNGADGWVDINTFNGSRKEWNQFLLH